MEANILQTPNMSGIEKVSSGKLGTQTTAKGNISKKDLLFLNLLSLQQKQAAANVGKTKGKKAGVQNLEFVEDKGKDGEKGKTAAEILAASLLIKQNPELINQNSKANSSLVNKTVSAKPAKAAQTNNLLALKSKASLNPKNEVDIDNKIIAQKLAELNEVEAGDTGLKLKQGMAEKQIATTNQIAKNGPQTKGRVFVRGEERFLQPSFSKENSALQTFSATDIKETDQRLKQVGLTGYGLKKISDNIEANEVERESFATSNLDVGRMNTEVKANASNFNATEQTQSNTNFDSIMEQVDNGLKTSYNHQLKEMKIKLQPEELGEIEVKFRIENNMMKAEFVVESEIVKETLESRFNQLKDNLLERGINASEVNVYVSSGNEGKGDNSGYQRENLLTGKSVKSVNSKLNQETLNTNLDAVTRTTNIVDKSGVNILV
jgi:flagellar hook-length control protein FliK